jgi:23S rRNA (cytidine2498-2'-O)-methyltransferase
LGGERRRDERRPPPKPHAPRPQPPRRVFPTVTPGPLAPPQVGEWLLTTRAGAETDLIEELAFLDEKTAGHPVAPALVAARDVPRAEGRPVELAFARQGFPVAVVGTPDALAAHPLVLPARVRPWALDAWVPDSDEANPLAAEAQRLGEAMVARFPDAWRAARVADARAAFAENGHLVQLARWGHAAAAGVLWAREAPSLAPGGRLRAHVPAAAPSRAAMKLAEAFAWLDRAPDRGDACVDLGAAPGGWTWVLLERGAKVYAVDPAQLSPSLRGRKGLTHLRADAFKFDPGEEPIDWLLSDMAWRPLEAAALYARWARRQWARFLVANLKLPMKKKAEILARVREILVDGGWSHVRARQLYHDRDEVTVAAVRLR